jgi:LPXTG-site transpeptidase (sortase) family protein
MTVHRIKSYRVVQHKTLRYVWPFTLKAKTDRILRELKPDAVHINSHMIVGRYLLRSARQQGIRVIATNHIMPENLIKYSLVIPRWAEKIAMTLAWKDAGRILKKADVVTTPTRKAANLLETAAGLTGVLAVSCGIEASKFANNTPTTNTQPRVLYLGRLDSEKHIHNLIKAIALLPKSLKVELEIVGDGGEREYLEQLSKDLGISKNVVFRGHISDEELPKVYERATVFAMPSIAELQSIATMEAMASGRPVVAADAMALPHLVHDGDNGYLFPPDNVKVLADRLLKVLTADQKELDRLSENSLHLIQSHDIDRTIRIFEGLYSGEEQEENETADNLDTYSLPIGSLSKSISRSIALARRRSAKLREQAEQASKELLSRAEDARDEVKERLEEVRDEVAFAAKKLEIRVRKGVRKAAERLRAEGTRRSTVASTEPALVDASSVPPHSSKEILQKRKWLQEVESAIAITTSALNATYSAVRKWIKEVTIALIRKATTFSAFLAKHRHEYQLRSAEQRVRRLKALQSKLRKRIAKASTRLSVIASGPSIKAFTNASPPADSPAEVMRGSRSSIVNDLMISAGALLLLFVFWYLFINDPIQGQRQNQSALDFAAQWHNPDAPTTYSNPMDGAYPSTKDVPVTRSPQAGKAFALLYVPRFGDDYVRTIAEGVEDTVLNSNILGVGRYSGSDQLGGYGNFALAAHRTSFGAPFGNIGELRLGDYIYVEVPEGWHAYAFRNLEYVWETEIGVLNSFPKLEDEVPGSRVITLTSCHPKFTVSERVIAYGVYIGWYPREGGPPSEVAELMKDGF